MGQPVVVTQKSGARPGMFRFEANRVFTGMAHERYESEVEVVGDRPPDEVARRLFAHGGVASVHVYGNVITVQLARGGSPAGLKEILESLYTYYREGVQPAIP